MGFADKPTSGAPIEAYHCAASGAPVGADPMALIERSPVGVVTLRAPGYRPVTTPPAPNSVKLVALRGSHGARGQWLRVAVVAFVVVLAVIGAVLAGVFWR